MFLVSNLYSSQDDFVKSNFYLNLSYYLNPKFYFNLSLIAENQFLNQEYDKVKKTLRKFQKQDSFYYWYKLKKEAILKHQTQDPQRFVSLFELMNSYRAAQCNAPKGNYAEAYNFIPSFPFSDIREILPSPLKLRPFQIENQHGFL